MGIYIVVDETSGLIDNRIDVDDIAAWPVPEGHYVVEDVNLSMEIGGTYIDGVYTPPQKPLLPPAPQSDTVLLYDHENRLRSLEGQPPMTLGDFVTKMKGK